MALFCAFEVERCGARQVMACSIEREARGRPAEVSCMDVVEGKAPKAQEIGQGARAWGLHGLECFRVDLS